MRAHGYPLMKSGGNNEISKKTTSMTHLAEANAE